MQSKLHRPERQAEESQATYRQRSAASRYVAALGRSVETGQPMLLKGLGDQHKAPGSRQQQRDDKRRAGGSVKGTFGASLVASWAKKRRDSKAHQLKNPARDPNGTVTLIGQGFELIGVKPTTRDFVISGGQQNGENFYCCRRIWLAGISAQRGF